jgi:hypothetical protein
MVVSRAATPPVIDGTLSPVEWDRAPACSAFTVAFHGHLAHNQSVAWVTYDDRFLYVAIRNNRGTHDVLLSKRARETDDQAIVFDHSNEIWFTPPSSPQATYQTLFNAYPAVFDVKMIPSVGYTAKAWNGRWTIASSETREHWIVEARAPLASFGVERIEPGAKWQGLFTTDVLGPSGGFRAWAPGGAFAEINRHSHLHFQPAGPVVQLLGVESVFTGKARFPMAANGEGGSVHVSVRFGAGVEPSEDDLVVEKVVELRDWQRVAFDVQADLTKFSLPTKKTVVQKKPRVEKEYPHGICEVHAKADDATTLYRQLFPFTIDGHVRTPPAEIKKSPYDTPFGLQAFYAPLSKKLLVQIDRYYTDPTPTIGFARLMDPKTGKQVVRRAIAPFRNDYSRFAMDLAKLDIPVQTKADWEKAQPVIEENKTRKKQGQPPKPVPGPQPVEYHLEVELDNGAGKPVVTHQIPVKLIGYQFEWMPNTIGISDEVIPPWTPVQWKDGAVSMWNKTYRLNGLGLADEIINNGRKQLHGPMKLVAVVNAQTRDLTEDATTDPGKLTAAAAEQSGNASISDLDVSVATRVEFDGFVFNTMTLKPKRPVNLNRLSLTVRMPKAEAPCFVTTAGGWSAYHGWTPQRWTSKETSSGSRVGNFVPYVFLTDSDRGFCWFADNDRGWFLDPNEPTIELVTEDDEVELRVHFVNKLVTLEKPTTIRYGWMVTPQKPQRPGWRATHINHHKPYPKATCVFYGMDNINWAVLWPYYSSPYPWDYEKSRRAFDASRKKGVITCAGNIAHAIARYRDAKGRWFNELAADWGTKPGDRSNGNVTRCRGTNDFQLWHFDQWIRRSGMQGLYFDENYLGEEWNTLKGSAYRLADRVQPGYSYLGLREYNKRLRYLFNAHGMEPPRLWLHTTSGHPVYAWMPDVAMEGENVEPASRENDYMECLPASRLRSIGMGRNLGAAALIMCQADRHWNPAWSEFMVQQFVGWVLAHDCLPESNLFWPVLAAEMEMWQPDIRFLPYWKNDLGIESRTDDVLVSAHVRPGRAILWLVNTAHEDRRARVLLDLTKLGLDRDKTVVFDAETGQRHELSRGWFARRYTLRADVPKRFWRAIRLVQTERLKHGITFTASFDGDEVAADEAFGHRYARGRGPGPVKTVPGGRAGRCAPLDHALSFDARHHIGPPGSAVAWHLKLSEPAKATGVLCSIGPKLTLRLNRGTIKLLGEGNKPLGQWKVKLENDWHGVQLNWDKRTLYLEVDSAQALKADLPSGLPIRPMGRGLEIQNHRKRIRPPRITFGPIKGARMDDLFMSRPDREAED